MLSQVVVAGAGTASGASVSDSQAVRGDAVRRAGNHLFARRGDRWADVSFKEGTKVVRIKPYSAAYFALLDAIPELRGSLAVGERVLVSGAHVSIEVSADGVSQLGDAELRSLKEQW